MEAKLRAFHRAVVLALGYCVVIVMIFLGAVELANKIRLAEGLRSTWLKIDYSALRD